MKAILKVYGLAMLAFALQTGEASTIQKMSLGEMTRRASSIVVGKVIDVRYQQAQGHLWTLVQVVPERTLKGAVGGTILFRVPGGQQTVNGRVLVTHVDGAPVFNSLQRGVFFLSGKGPEIPQPLGWSQGVFRVETRGGKEMVTASSDEVSQEPVMELRSLIERVEREKEIR